MWVSEVRAVTFGSPSVLWFSKPDALRRATLEALRSLAPSGLTRSPEVIWSEYESARAKAHWTDHRELPLEPFLHEALGPPPGDMAALASTISERLSAFLEWYPDVLPTVDYLRESGYATGLLLDLPVPLPPAWTERASRWFDAIVSSREVGFRTPAAPMFLEAARRLHAVPGRVLHVGDGLAEDVHGGLRAGLHAALLERPQRHVPDPAGMEWLRAEAHLVPADVHPDLRLRSLEELAAAMDTFG